MRVCVCVYVIEVYKWKMERISAEQRENWGRENYLSPETFSLANILMADSGAGGVIFLKNTEPE